MSADSRRFNFGSIATWHAALAVTGIFFESMHNCAEFLCLDVKTVRARQFTTCLRWVMIVIAESKPGFTRTYRVTRPAEWEAPYRQTDRLAPATPTAKGTPPIPSDGLHPPYPETDSTPTSQIPTKVFPEVTPSEVNPMKGETAPSILIKPKGAISTASERISYEKERDRIALELKQIEGQASHDAWGPVHYDAGQKKRIKELRDRDKYLMGELRCVV